MKEEKYFIVEARLPIQVNDAETPIEAARKAATIFEERHGVILSNWELRIFEYSGDDTVGVVAEYFSSPSGAKFRDRLQNLEKHQKHYEEGTQP